MLLGALWQRQYCINQKNHFLIFYGNASLIAHGLSDAATPANPSYGVNAAAYKLYM